MNNQYDPNTGQQFALPNQPQMVFTNPGPNNAVPVMPQPSVIQGAGNPTQFPVQNQWQQPQQMGGQPLYSAGTPVVQVPVGQAYTNTGQMPQGQVQYAYVPVQGQPIQGQQANPQFQQTMPAQQFQQNVPHQQFQQNMPPQQFQQNMPPQQFPPNNFQQSAGGMPQNTNYSAQPQSSYFPSQPSAGQTQFQRGQQQSNTGFPNQSQPIGGQHSNQSSEGGVKKSKGKKKTKQEPLPNFGITSESSDDESSKKTSKSKEKKPPSSKTKSKPSVPPPKPLDIIKSPKELLKLGEMSELDSSDDVYKIIQKYAKNSSEIGTKGILKINKIVELGTMIPSSKKPKQDPNRMLLWFKTTPGSALKLANPKDGLVAFYDRLGRVLAVSPKDLSHPFRQTILLCQVALGREYKARQGYRHWTTAPFPSGYDSIKVTGKMIPDFSANEEIFHSTIVPSGKSVKETKFPNHEVPFNEYIIQEIQRVKVRYAVDLEFIPGLKGDGSGSSDQDGSESD